MPQQEVKSLLKIRWMLSLLGCFKIPLVGYVRPKLIFLSDEQAVVRIKLRRRTRNHLKSMYFGALAVGADISGGLHAFYFAEKHGLKVSFAFKDMQANFLKRAESHVLFKSEDGSVVESTVLKSKTSGERVNQPVRVVAYNINDEVVAEFKLTVSIKVR
jgi:acyl-coenzyme A thioesterase PaaI-like protein